MPSSSFLYYVSIARAPLPTNRILSKEPVFLMNQAPSQKPLELITITPPAPEQRVRRLATFSSEDEKKNRYSLPHSLDSASPVGYRHRLSLTPEEATQLLPLFSLERPSSFLAGAPSPTEQHLFEEASLGILSARQSTNYKGHHQITLGPEDSAALLPLLQQLQGIEAPPLEHATHTHVVLSRPYRTPFTLLLTFIGHQPIKSLLTVPRRAFDKKTKHADDIPTIGFLQHIHLGILADAMERAALIASQGTHKAQVFIAPFCDTLRGENQPVISLIEDLIGLTGAEKRQGWRVALVAQTGAVAAEEQIELSDAALWRKLGANLLAMRSERIQPGVNQEEKAPEQYQQRQDMDVPDELTVMCGRAAYNAFTHWTGCDREVSKDLLLMERIDVLTPNGKTRLREVRQMLDTITDRVMKNIPLWADLPTGKALSRNAARGKKAFALAGQRIYIGGLDRTQLEANHIGWERAIRAFGASAARSALTAEFMGCVDLPTDCDLLAGICLMAGPINQNDIGKSFYEEVDLLHSAFPDMDPTSLLVWTLKAKTIADPVGNEEQLLNESRKGALVDLRPGPHEVVEVRKHGRRNPMRQHQDRVNAERAFHDVANFLTDPEGTHIPGNPGSPWPEAWSAQPVWS